MPVYSDTPKARVYKTRSSTRPHRLPKGWRWLKMGELARQGDVMCDPRIEPIMVTVNNPAYRLTDSQHPVRRKLGITKREILRKMRLIDHTIAWGKTPPHNPR